jgi:FkbM family methyltransferase
MKPPEMKYIRHFLSATSICFDIGAHGGSWTRALSQFVNQGHVYAFEALPYYADVLKRTMKILRRRNLTIINAAITEKNCTVELIWKDNSGTELTGKTHVASGRESLCESIPVRGMTLDSFWEEIGKRKVDFIKCDVEGLELFVLKGATHLINYCKPIFYNELNLEWCNRYDYLPEDIFHFFQTLDYAAYYIDLDQGLLPVETKCHIDGDILFIPQSYSIPKTLLTYSIETSEKLLHLRENQLL